MSAPLILGTNSIKETGTYNVANSLRFNDDDLPRLTRTPSSSGNRRTFTISAWIKLGAVDTGTRNIFSAATNGSNYALFRMENHRIEYLMADGSVFGYLSTNRLFKDPSAWFHVVVAIDTTNATAGNRMRLYVNGVEETDFATDTNPSLNADTLMNHTNEHNVGMFLSSSSGSAFDGYIAELVVVDGQQLDPTSFGEFDSNTGIWIPKDVSDLTFGTNGFYLDFENSSTLGNDVSGNNHDFSSTNLATTDQSTDTCTNNFCTLNPLTKRSGGNGTLREGNLEYEASGGDSSVYGTMGIPAGMKIYFEVKLISNTAQNSLGIHNVYDGGDGDFVKGGSESGTYAYKVRGAANDTQYFNNGSLGGTVVSNYSAGTIIGVAVDNENGQIHYSANGTFINSSDPTDNNPVALVTGFGGSNEQYLHFSLDTSGGTNPKNQFNFGSPPYSISSGNSDAEGFGNFEYAVPSGYFALCTKNLAEYG
jgi:hypothetical protein